jgi:DNA-binding response OmpR family regulator
MASILVLMMSSGDRAQELEALRAAGHEVRPVEPRWPECKPDLSRSRPDLVIVDGGRSPSHGRATARWMSTQARLRTVPFLFVDVPDQDMDRTRRELPRAQFATWASVVGAAARLVKRR